MGIENWGALAVGVVIGWVTYRTIRRTQSSGLSDISAVIGAVGGAAVTTLFPSGSQAFGAYGLGLAAGFFSYLIVSMIVADQKLNEWLGEPRGTSAPVKKVTSGVAVPPLPD